MQQALPSRVGMMPPGGAPQIPNFARQRMMMAQ
jgi:hypothetical protein